jgi:2-polyprenyl-6-methoxyphenol hydroxylase-like FAD-dependent oxidoreductase
MLFNLPVLPLDIEQDEAGVSAWVGVDGGRRIKVRARYLVGADGARSQVRAALGIEMDGNEVCG